jgi:hypothetical protein
MNPKVSKNRLADWSLELESYNGYWDNAKPVDISKLTIDEQADLIVKKLSEPPKLARRSEFDIMSIISKTIAEEIDRSLLETLKTKGLTK